MNWLENMVLQTKLMLLAIVLMIGIVILGVIGYSGISQWSKDMTTFGEKRMPVMLALGSLNRERMAIRAQTYEAWKYQNDAGAIAGFQKIIDQRKKSWEIIDQEWKVIEAFNPSSEEGKKIKDDLLPAYKAWRDEYVELDNLLSRLVIPHDAITHTLIFATYLAKVSQMVPISDKMGKSMNDMAENNKVNTVNMIDGAISQSSSSNTMMIVIIVVVLSVGILLTTVIIRSITRSITSSVTAIRDGAMQITSASDQVASSSSSLAQGASEQASSVEEVSATLEESTAINTQNTDNARQADILARNANDSAKAGYEKGEQLSHSMHAITESAAKISGIIKTIDQIAFQTNLLALNAAVEAARAGEHGLGFAVVADEVRNLAQRAASAAKETSDIIEEVVGQIKEGNQIALATHTSFQEIVEQSKKVSDLIGEIAIAGKEQAEGMTQINQAMGQVDQVTQQVAANSEEAAAAAEELNAQATSMMETVRILAKMVGMESDAPAAHSIKKMNLHHIEMKAQAPAPRKAPPALKSKAAPKADEVFPLSENDLKEF
ncbi:methyl-accepting chemotaxis sensory transducer [Sulfuricurvum kujiense DSM 16994]|uniref:Methyl-accepting chemotaxis sensory transducer n=1 Tax=Sulfuricurvum kujiense (strain ATCC BAA-921 / DSM 16994 / JCM 11577 / YK-1) TaxID=709032 RepID=E4U0K4_SULKY|nr:methyl-accepting chemotaxis protein [Sulfuricurvum kujiense]ADR34321.1 methyl-accepting chemotaxis sensory transducer [Sulfuricurvum kujiense DSM 16994]